MKTRNFALAISIWSAIISAASAGGGPENVFLVVNPKSQDSLTIANHFIHLRQIPGGNVLYLPFDPKTEDILVDPLRSKILIPIFETIQSRRLSAQIDYIAYSCDFPYRIVCNSDLRKIGVSLSPDDAPASDKVKLTGVLPHLNPVLLSQSLPVASLNGLTYLYQSVLKEEPENYLDLHSNYYMRLPTPEQVEIPSIGFRSAWQFGPNGELVESNGKSYMLSVLLGITFGRGNTVDEIVQYLKRSAASDCSHPSGTIYFVQNTDVRSRARHHLFPDAVKELEKLGVSAQIINGTVPINKNDVQGVVMGTSDFDWKASGSTILPGAICEDFTSFGGVMTIGAQQTPLTEFLRYGAAGASGTVTEPIAILNKFPLPSIQLHYARGCSLAEAFFQSIYAPYQILIVGDPLCRPWANIPNVKVSGIKPDDKVKGTLTITPTATTPSGQGIDHFELFVNGSRATQCKPGQSLVLDSTLLPDGYQELRIVAVEAGPIQSQGRVILPIITDNSGRSIEAKVTSQDVIRPDNPLTIEVNSPGSIGVIVLQNSRIVGRLPGENGQIKIQAADLGSGPVRLQVIGLGQGGPKTHVLAPPIVITVETSDTNNNNASDSNQS